MTKKGLDLRVPDLAEVEQALEEARSRWPGRPVMLDAFCCQGAASRGYVAAGWAVVGVDAARRHLKRYPYPSLHGNAVEVLRRFGHLFKAAHGSPPCQRYTRGNAGHDTSDYPDLIGPTREALDDLGIPWVIENVEDAWPELRTPMLLCGSMFGLGATDADGTPLRLERHRLFESNVWLIPPDVCTHNPHVQVAGLYGGAPRTIAAAKARAGGYVPASRRVLEELLGVEPGVLSEEGLFEAIPPAFTEYLGTQLLEAAQAT